MPERGLRLLGLLVACGCAASEPTPPELLGPQPLLHGEAQRERLCGRGRSDPVIDVFCGREHGIESFEDLRRALGFVGAWDNTQGYALTGHSTSLVSRVVSAINPRAIFIQLANQNDELVLLSFARGEQFSEAIVRDRATRELRFYLTTFENPCNETEAGCTPGDLLTPAIERDWRNVDVYAEDDLVNTPLDCLPCHQPDGPESPRILRMQELDPPWNHWFFSLVPGGMAVIDDYLAAKGDESFAGIAGAPQVRGSNPGMLTSAVFLENPTRQPNVFDSVTIEREVRESASAQPHDNSVPGESETWQKIYDRAKRGDAIAVPYHDVKVTDPDKLASMTQAYVDYREGRIEAAALPDIRDVYPDDPERLSHMGFATEPGLDGEGVLKQACGQCHNDRLDQTVSRARFNVDLAKLDRQAKDRAIARIQLPDGDPALMPPARMRTLSQEARERLIELLEE